ncbi:dGTPase [Hazenella sp. IB182357]|uniref:Deoxyguanosinetriphosphate triphosphohydrolase-like protein n=1 Tax=Polycladospora coralii TaxID=2771432 RepID=A0A926RWN2_9BACL|nr:anti-phage deoxyguanosine triphosphatase [Polycladospora coralii]MBD1371686.1 dGTPase [Polycladospora coralii]MBS7529153.1 dGTPase [Polycladospora coralii]
MILKRNHSELYQDTDMERYGQGNVESKVEARDPFEKDYGRIVHSGAFRRLQAKTQVIGAFAGDVHRTRLTHSMEVAQIARGIVIHLNETNVAFQENPLDASLVEGAALAHDFGHPPFGHRGEEVLHACMLDFGGFEGNAHTFRLLTKLEGGHGKGLNLTRGLLLSLLKYPVILDHAVIPEIYEEMNRIHPPKASIFQCDEEMFQWLLSPFTDAEKDYFCELESPPHMHKRTAHKTLECAIIELADDIAYSTHDIEDAIQLGFIHMKQVKQLLIPYLSKQTYPELVQAFQIIDQLDPDYHQLKYGLKPIFSALIAMFVTRIRVNKSNPQFTSPRLQYTVTLPPELVGLLEQLKQLVMSNMIESQRVETISYKGTYMIKNLFEAFMNEEKLLPENDRIKFSSRDSDLIRARVTCDYIAGMTDSFALRMHARLFGQSQSFLDF